MDSPLNSLGLQIKEHWEKYRPQMVRELDHAGALDEAAKTAEDLTVAAYDQAIRAGLAPGPGVGTCAGGVGVSPRRGGPAEPR